MRTLEGLLMGDLVAHVSPDEQAQLNEVRLRVEAGSTLAAQAIAGDVNTEAALIGILGHFKRIDWSLKAIGW